MCAAKICPLQAAHEKPNIKTMNQSRVDDKITREKYCYLFIPRSSPILITTSLRSRYGVTVHKSRARGGHQLTWFSRPTSCSRNCHVKTICKYTTTRHNTDRWSDGQTFDYLFPQAAVALKKDYSNLNHQDFLSEKYLSLSCLLQTELFIHSLLTFQWILLKTIR